MHIRPQSIPPVLEVADVGGPTRAPGRAPDGTPILALIDGVPIAEHPVLAGRLVVDDQFGLEPLTEVQNRFHGTAMSSVIAHGDRNIAGASLPRRIHVVPVMTWDGGREAFPPNQLVIDLVYRAVVRMREGQGATAPDVIVINLSLGNTRRPFQGQMSAWARLLDRLAWRFGILFIVSAGNLDDSFDIPGFQTNNEFEDADPATRAAETLSSLARLMPQRRIISPAETVNGITIGAVNDDAVPDAQRRAARLNVDPYSAIRMANPSSRLGPGFADSVKPDILMPGARERLRTRVAGAAISVAPAAPTRAFGIKAAVPPVGGNVAAEGYTGKTSAAAAFGSRTCHLIHDALETNYRAEWMRLSHIQRAVLLKALLVHPAAWPEDAAQLIATVVGPADPKQHVRRKDNIRRFLGYGTFDPADAVACAADRATFWAVGSLAREQSVLVNVPIPICIRGQARIHSMSATLAWFTPVQAGRRSYRSVRLKLLEPEELGTLRVLPVRDQPDSNQIRRGTVSSRRWSGDRAPAVVEGMNVQLIIQREPDQGSPLDEAVHFGLAVTLTMPGVVELYDQVRLSLQPRVRPRGR